MKYNKKNHLNGQQLSRLRACWAGRAVDDFAYLVIGAEDELRADGTRLAESIQAGQFKEKTLLQIVNAACIPELKELIVQEVHLRGTLYGVIILPRSPHVHRFCKDVQTIKRKWPKNTIPVRSGEEIIVAEEIRLMENQKAAWSVAGGLGSPKLLKLRKRLTIPTHSADNHHNVPGTDQTLVAG